MKLSRAFYSAAVEHRQINGIYLGCFAVPGEASQWVLDNKGSPKHFTTPEAAELAGFRVLVAKLNRSRDVQVFGKIKPTDKIRSYHAPKQEGEPTIESVFGKK